MLRRMRTSRRCNYRFTIRSGAKESQATLDFDRLNRRLIPEQKNSWYDVIRRDGKNRLGNKKRKILHKTLHTALRKALHKALYKA